MPNWNLDWAVVDFVETSSIDSVVVVVVKRTVVAWDCCKPFVDFGLRTVDSFAGSVCDSLLRYCSHESYFVVAVVGSALYDPLAYFVVLDLPPITDWAASMD